MRKLNKPQIIGIGILAIAIATYFLTENSITQTSSGVLSAIGVGLILKWNPFKKSH